MADKKYSPAVQELADLIKETIGKTSLIKQLQRSYPIRFPVFPT